MPEASAAEALQDLFRWESDFSEPDERYGYAVIEQPCTIVCTFVGDMEELGPFYVTAEESLPLSAQSDFSWSELVLAGEFGMPSHADLVEKVTAAPENLILVVDATTHGYSRFRSFRKYRAEPGMSVPFEMRIDRSELRGVLDVKCGVVLATDIPPSPGRASSAYTRIIEAPPVSIQVDGSDPLHGTGMEIRWEHFGDSDKSLFRWSIDASGEEGPKVAVELNDACKAVQAVLDSVSPNDQKARARKFILNTIAAELMTQIAMFAREVRDDSGDDSETYETLLKVLRRRGVSEIEIQESKSFDGLAAINTKLQSHYRVHEFASKLVLEMVGEVEEGA